MLCVIIIVQSVPYTLQTIVSKFTQTLFSQGIFRDLFLTKKCKYVPKERKQKCYFSHYIARLRKQLLSASLYMMLWFSIHCKSLIAIATRPKLVLLWTPVILATLYIAVIVGLSTFVRCLYSHISWWIIDRSTYLTMTIKDTVIEHKDPQSLWYKGGKSLRDSFEYTEGPFHPTRHLNIRPDSHSADQSKLIRRTTCYLHIKFSL